MKMEHEGEAIHHEEIGSTDRIFFQQSNAQLYCRAPSPQWQVPLHGQYSACSDNDICTPAHTCVIH